jgi:hypothetical protein
MSEYIKDELDEELDLGFDDEEFAEETEVINDDGDVEFDYDGDGNVIISDDSEESNAEEKSEDDFKTDSKDVNDNVDKQQDETAGDDAEVVEPAKAPDEKDIEIAKLKKALAERDAQIRETLKSLGADENEGVAGLERIAAEAEDKTVEEYRDAKVKRIEQEEAIKLIKKQRFEEKIRADLSAIHQAYPETKQYKSVFEFPNFAKFSEYRDLGLSPDEAYIATHPKSVINSAAGAAAQRARNLNNTKQHLRSNVPVGAKDNSITISKKEISEYRDLFPNMSDKEIVALYKQTIKK